MAEQKKIVFKVADVKSEEKLIREYISPAFHRIKSCDEVRWPIFNRYAQDPSVNKGEVVLRIFGDIKPFVDNERSRWKELTNDDMILRWKEVDIDEQIDELSDQERFDYHLRSTASQMSLEFFKSFDSLPNSSYESNSEGNKIGVGLCLHHIVNQLGYQKNCGEEEISIMFQCLISRLYAMAIAPGYGTEFAGTKIEELTAELESLPPKLQQLDDEHQP